LVRVMKVSRSGYYEWLKRKPSARSAHQKKLKQEIMMIFVESDSIYGAPKITEQLHDKGYIIAERTVGKYMRELGIRSTVVKKFKPQSKAKRDLPYENILKQKFRVPAPNVAWVTDITYIWTKK